MNLQQIVNDINEIQPENTFVVETDVKLDTFIQAYFSYKNDEIDGFIVMVTNDSEKPLFVVRRWGILYKLI